MVIQEQQRTTEGVNEPRFPSFTFNQGWVGGIRSIDAICKPSRLAVKKGFYKRLFIVDSDLRKFQVASAQKVRTLFDVSFRTFLRLLGGNQLWQMKVTFGPPVQLSLMQVKELFASCFKGHQEYWDEMSDFDEFRSKISEAKSLEQIFQLFKEFHQMD